MLKEFPRVRQEPGEYRRLFSDEGIDLYVWYAPDRMTVTGFQILYFDGNAQKVVTWNPDEGCEHMGVDDWDSTRFNKTPLLVADGIPAYRDLLRRLEGRLDELEPAIRTLVIEALSSA